MAGEVGALRITLGANTAQFEQGMRRAAQTARSTGQDIDRSLDRAAQSGTRAFSTLRTAIAGFAAALAGGALFNYARSAVEWASGLSETAQQIGVTVQQLQVLRLAAEQNGASVQGMERAVAILNRTLGQARAGLPAAIEAFRAIGISREQLENLRSAGDAFPVVAEAISRFGTSSEQAAAAQQIFGRGATELLPILAQGREGYDEATQAAIRNGVVTDEQARKADEAADAFGAMASALRVQLLDAVSDALPGLVTLAQTLGGLLGIVIQVFGWIGRLAGAIGELFRVRSTSMADYIVGIARTVAPARPWQSFMPGSFDPNGPVPADPRLNLSGGGRPRGGGGGQQRSQDDIARRAHQYDTEERRLQIDNLRARAENTQALDERNVIQQQIEQLERDQAMAEIQFRQSQGEINAAQAERLTLLTDQLHSLRETGRALEYNQRVAEEESRRAEQQEGYARDRMRFEADMAQTMAERRRIELDLLRITMEQRRKALADLITAANARGDPNAAAVAQLELDNLGNLERQENRRIMRDTRGPLESFISQLPQTAEQIRESLQSIAVDGLGSIQDALVGVIMGTESMGKAFKRVASQIIADLLRIQLQKAIIGPLANMLGGLFGGAGGGGGAGILNSIMGGGLAGARAAGGPVLPGRTYLIGEKGPELLQMGGTGGHVIANDNIGGGGGSVTIHQTFEFQGVAVTQDEFMQGLLATKDATMRAVQQAGRRRG